MHLKKLCENILLFISHSYLINWIPYICKKFLVKNLGFLQFNVYISVIQKNSFLIKPTTNKGYFWSIIAGYTSFLIHAGGTPINFYLLPQKLNKTIYMGTITIVFLIINSIKLIPYYYLGQLDLPNLKASLILSPLAPISILFGYYLHKKVSDNIFYYFIYFFLGIGGLKLIYEGIF